MAARRGRHLQTTSGQPVFRDRFRLRLNELASTVFTLESFGPWIDSLQKNLDPEVRLRAETFGRDPEAELRSFHDTITSLRRHMIERRAFVLSALEEAP